MTAPADAGCLHEAAPGEGVLGYMIAFHPSAIRHATDADASALARLAQLDSTRPLSGDILIAEEAGVAVAATSLHDRRVIANPFRSTVNAQAALRVRAGSLRAVEHTPSLASRMRAAFASVRPGHAAA